MFIYDRVIQEPGKYSFAIDDLGPCTVQTPLKGGLFVGDDDQVVFSSQVRNLRKLIASKYFPAFQKAGPREKIFHDPSWSRAAIVTCGGLCPGLNDVIKGLVNILWWSYGIRTIYGLKYGYQGLSPKYHHAPLILTPEVVDGIHEKGGTILGSSRGNQDVGEMVDTLMRMHINILFCIGGDGTLKGARDIAVEAQKRKQPISVIGIPKTIDNDLAFVEKTFGFETAVYQTFDVVSSAHNEAEGAFNGISLVKLMGRDSGFIAAAATIANSLVDFCLIPEIDFELEGETGLLAAVGRCLEKNRHAVMVVAEGAGQKFFAGDKTKDASGNVLHKDIGLFLKDEMNRYFKSKKLDFSIKYFDPSYLIRSVAAQGTDAIFCHLLAEHAVHAAMAGKTNCLIGHWNNFFTHVPIALATIERRKIYPEEALWKGVLCSTNQNDYFQAK
ncbi:MAG TPA: ATP-dependent 6-phosphofructokinase [bacterium]|nr:ATP-dependent 6-phosphofructokinase [bacterium]